MNGFKDQKRTPSKRTPLDFRMCPTELVYHQVSNIYKYVYFTRYRLVFLMSQQRYKRIYVENSSQKCILDIIRSLDDFPRSATDQDYTLVRS